MLDNIAGAAFDSFSVGTLIQRSGRYVVIEKLTPNGQHD
jgi:hypothetical protein